MTRTRNNSTNESVTQTGYAIYPDGRRDDDFTVYSLPQLDVMVDVVTPSFKKKSREGMVIISPMEKIQTKMMAVTVPWYRSRTVPRVGTFYNFESRHTGPGLSDKPWLEPAVIAEISKLETAAVTSAFAKVGEPDLQTLTELAELKETLGFLLSPAKKMAQVGRELLSYIKKRKRFEEAFLTKLAKWEARNPRYRGPKPVKGNGPTWRVGRFEATDISSAWLAYRYAIMPLVYSFQDIQKHLDRKDHPKRMTARSKESDEVSLDTNPSLNSAGGNFGSIVYRQVRKGEAKVTCRGGVLYAADWSLNRQLGLQMHQVPATMYEVIPLSFVLDWFYTGSDAYQAITATLRSDEILGSWVTTTVEFGYTMNLEASSVAADTTCHSGGTTLVASGKWKRRRLASMSNIAVQLKIDLNAKRVVDALSLSHLFLATAIKEGAKRA